MGKITGLALVLLLLWGCTSNNQLDLDDGKPPTVTYGANGSIFIDRLDPGESVEITIPLQLEGEKI